MRKRRKVFRGFKDNQLLEECLGRIHTQKDYDLLIIEGTQIKDKQKYMVQVKIEKVTSY